MVKAYLVALALMAAPVLATSTYDDLESRQISEQRFETRELSNKATLYSREEDFDQLFSRFAAEHDLDIRDVEIQELYERNKVKEFFKKMWRGIKKVTSAILGREDSEEDLVARDDELDALFERYMDDIESREEVDNEELFGRDFEFEERDIDDLD